MRIEWMANGRKNLLVRRNEERGRLSIEDTKYFKLQLVFPQGRLVQGWSIIRRAEKNISTATVVRIIPISRSVATRTRSPRRRIRPLEKKRITPERRQAPVRAASHS